MFADWPFKGTSTLISGLFGFELLLKRTPTLDIVKEAYGRLEQIFCFGIFGISRVMLL